MIIVYYKGRGNDQILFYLYITAVAILIGNMIIEAFRAKVDQVHKL